MKTKHQLVEQGIKARLEQIRQSKLLDEKPRFDVVEECLNGGQQKQIVST